MIKTKDMERQRLGQGRMRLIKIQSVRLWNERSGAMRINKNERCSFMERERDPVPSNKRVIRQQES